MSFTDWTGLSGVALVWMLLALRLPVAIRLSHAKRVLFVLVIYGVALLPILGLSLAGFLRGHIGDLSITSVLLLIAALVARLRQLAGGDGVVWWSLRERFALFFFVSVLALLLYPFALGIGMLDPYRSGFGGVGLLVMLALLSLWSMRRGSYLLPTACSLAVLAWSLGWYESTNIWDYLIDVPLAIYAIVQTIKVMMRARKVERV
ncbi:MAG: hypothetical protein FD121_1034 [Gallionellaceae bacterium]|nr:MAG: hypothetical protein FD121_1034 [Gallionellaceae bacterium]